MTIISLVLAFYGNPLSGKPRSMIPFPAPTSDRVCRTPFCLHTHQRGAQSHTCRGSLSLCDSISRTMQSRVSCVRTAHTCSHHCS
jgi:hypothetical protein